MTITTAPFGRLMTAMITPMTSGGDVDYDGAARLATYLVDDMRNEGLVVNGTTGEAPTTTDAEKERLIKVVLEAVGDRAKVVAGVGTNITAHTVELARQAERAGAHGLLVVTPYSTSPPRTRSSRTSPWSRTARNCRCSSTTSPAGPAPRWRPRP